MFTKTTVKWIIEGFKTDALCSHLLGLDDVFFNGKIVVHVSGSLIGRDPFNIILHPLDDTESLSCVTSGYLSFCSLTVQTWHFPQSSQEWWYGVLLCPIEKIMQP